MSAPARNDGGRPDRTGHHHHHHHHHQKAAEAFAGESNRARRRHLGDGAEAVP